MGKVIHKAVITAEAQFDYEETAIGGRMPKAAIKSEIEEYVANMYSAGLLRYDGYFRAKYLDEDSGKMLMLFLYRGQRFGVMQTWKLKGVCLAEDWNEDLEYDGQIRAWLNSKLNPEDKSDWVWDLRVWEREQKLLMEEDKHGYMAEIKDLLKNYNSYKVMAAVGNKENPRTAELAEKMEFLDKCIENLDESDAEIIRNKFVRKLSFKQITQNGYVSKSTLQRKIARIVAFLEACFAENFES